MAESPCSLGSPSRLTGFRPQPRHWPVSVRSAIDFRRFPKVLAIGSHFDDIWLGCAATLMLLQETYGAQVICTSLCNEYPYPYFGRYQLSDRRNDLHKFCQDLCKGLSFSWLDEQPGPDERLEDRGFTDNLAVLRTRITALWRCHQDVDLLFVPRQDDGHYDHVHTARAALAKFRRAVVLQYEIKDFRRVPFQPSLIVDVGSRSNQDLTLNSTCYFEAGEGSFAQKKAKILKLGFGAFLGGELPGMFDEDHSLGRMRIRAAESSGESRYAEAYATEILVS